MGDGDRQNGEVIIILRKEGYGDGEGVMVIGGW